MTVLLNFCAVDCESDDLEPTEIHRGLATPSRIQSVDVQRSYRAVDEPRPAPLAEAEARFPGIRRDAEGPRHVSVLTIQWSRDGEHPRGSSQEKSCIDGYRQRRLACRKDSRRERV